jgi:uncharacterized protein YuzE
MKVSYDPKHDAMYVSVLSRERSPIQLKWRPIS